MQLKLVKADMDNQSLIVEMLEEWTDYNCHHDAVNKTPIAIFKEDYRNWEKYLKSLEGKGDGIKKVPATTLFCLDEERNKMIGAVNIRHYLNDSLLRNGGHIGDGIRPSERGKGYGTAMIALALKECKNLGIDRVLMVCDKNNIASAKTIIKNGGILENEIFDEGVIIQRYWIELK